jgi:hypothetical protein
MSSQNPTSQIRHRRWLIPALLVIAWLVLGSTLGPYAGKLNQVIKNDNAAFLPKHAEATLALNEQKQLVGAHQPIFGTLVFERANGLTASDTAAIDAFVAKVPDLMVPEGFPIKAYLVPAPLTPMVSQDGKAISAIILFDDVKAAKPFANGKSPIAESVVTIRKEMQAAKVDGHVGGFAGILGDLIGIFQSINGTLFTARHSYGRFHCWPWVWAMRLRRLSCISWPRATSWTSMAKHKEFCSSWYSVLVRITPCYLSLDIEKNLEIMKASTTRCARQCMP